MDRFHQEADEGDVQGPIQRVGLGRAESRGVRAVRGCQTGQTLRALRELLRS